MCIAHTAHIGRRYVDSVTFSVSKIQAACYQFFIPFETCVDNIDNGLFLWLLLQQQFQNSAAIFDEFLAIFDPEKQTVSFSLETLCRLPAD